MNHFKYYFLLVCLVALSCKKRQNTSAETPSPCSNAGVDRQGFYVWKNGQKTYPQYKHTPETKEALVELLNSNTSLKEINTYYITDMSKLFEKRKDYNFDGIEDWIVCQVTTMQDMFSWCETFNKDLSNWNVSKVTNMRDMFFLCKKFNQDLSKWNVSNVTNMTGMFSWCETFNKDLSNWNVSNVVRMEAMFIDCPYFNQDLSKWNVSKVGNMKWLFRGCKAFDQDLSKWMISDTTKTDYMFDGTLMEKKTNQHPKKSMSNNNA